MSYRRFVLAAVALAGLVGTAAAARADMATDAAMEPVWERYWIAIAAAQDCGGYTFTQPQYDAMTHVINMKVDNAISAGRRIALIDDAKSTARDLAFKYGCNSPEIDPYRQLFRTELAPALQ